MSYIDTTGQYGRGNIDLNNRIVVHNQDGTISTEKSFSVNIDGREILLPSIVNGIVLSENDAIDYYLENNKYLGDFRTVAEADAYAEMLHLRQQWYYGYATTTNFYFRINNTDITRYIKHKGIKWTRNDIDSANAGRNLAGTMNRGRVITKVKLELSCLALNQSQTETLLSLIYPEYVTVDYIDPQLGERTGIQFYSNNVPATFCALKTDGSMEWDDISFPLVER